MKTDSTGAFIVLQLANNEHQEWIHVRPDEIAAFAAQYGDPYWTTLVYLRGNPNPIRVSDSEGGIARAIERAAREVPAPSGGA